MSQIEALNPQHHKSLKIDVDAAQLQLASVHMLPVMISEFQKLATEFPVLLTKKEDTGKFLAVALFGLKAGENLFWKNGGWQAVYKPLNLRRQPMMVGKNDNKKHADDQDYLLCLDVENPAVSEGVGEALFGERGEPTAYLQAMQAVLAGLIEGEFYTEKYIETLLTLGLVTPISLDVTLADGQAIKAEGLYSIDEDKLNALPAETLADLSQKGYLLAIYAMIISVGQIYHLVQKKNSLLAEPNAWMQSPV